ncbi:MULTISPECIES: outer membrane protein assembly factor BamB family protein [Haloferax]|uniref:outer membrane protein assembly factor BamB family protein n=1 Tax=Haloferax TaxID=2251 RepID=UPI000E242E8F|nr:MULTISPECIES: PQQ-like beta-propeller repeat protein [Haloferax]MBC9988368.1 hypothetical protein [Haloferax sp. AS1]RDZ34109.1 hypothetical protein C5B88_15905 [Haloferax sp. Atlit-24N]RLM36187.1 hypothetical protein DVK03_15525 [Haloferax sp. Atlit-109R]RLM41609.1 hypothetical protein DVK04_14845 [Haloferax sp. Atlit-105R]
MLSRREVLAAGGAALVSGVAGCGGSSPAPDATFDAPTTAWPTAGYDPQATGRAPDGPTEGTVSWSVSRSSADPPLYGALSPPVVADGTVYVTGVATHYYRPDDFVSPLAAIDAASGSVRWVEGFADGLGGGPAVVDDDSGTVVIGGYDGALHAVGSDGGSEWTADLGGRLGTPTAYGDRLYVESGSGRLHAVGSDGSRLWTADRPGPAERLLGPDEPVETTMPVADDRGVYAAFTPFDRGREAVVVLGYDHGGGRRWRTVLDGRYGRSPNGLAVTDDALYATVGGTVYALDPDTGEQRWQFVTGSAAAGPPTVDDERVYVGAKNLYALSRSEGVERWRVVNEAPPSYDRDPTALPYLARPPVADGRVYIRTGAVSAADGTRLWGGDADEWLQSGNYFAEPYYGRPVASPVVTGDAMYLTHAHRGVVKVA